MEIKYNLLKDNSPIWQLFKTSEEMNKRMKELKEQGYNPIKVTTN